MAAAVSVKSAALHGLVPAKCAHNTATAHTALANRVAALSLRYSHMHRVLKECQIAMSLLTQRQRAVSGLVT